MSKARTYSAAAPGTVVMYRVRRAGKPRREYPAVTTGTFADGTPCICVRWQREQSPTGQLVSDGVSFTYSEWDEIVRRVARVRAHALPILNPDKRLASSANGESR